MRKIPKYSNAKKCANKIFTKQMVFKASCCEVWFLRFLKSAK